MCYGKSEKNTYNHHLSDQPMWPYPGTEDGTVVQITKPYGANLKFVIFWKEINLKYKSMKFSSVLDIKKNGEVFIGTAFL